MLGKWRVTDRMNKQKFIVVKGRILTPGKMGIQYVIYDKVELNADKLETNKRKYVYRDLYTVEHKNAFSLRKNVTSRKRHILLHDESIMADSITVFDHSDGTFYGFIPSESFI